MCDQSCSKVDTYTEQHEHRINEDRYPYLEWDSKSRSHCLSWWRHFVPYTVGPLWSVIKSNIMLICGQCMLPFSSGRVFQSVLWKVKIKTYKTGTIFLHVTLCWRNICTFSRRENKSWGRLTIFHLEDLKGSNNFEDLRTHTYLSKANFIHITELSISFWRLFI
jgi:hypothetical protein